MMQVSSLFFVNGNTLNTAISSELTSIDEKIFLDIAVAFLDDDNELCTSLLGNVGWYAHWQSSDIFVQHVINFIKKFRLVGENQISQLIKQRDFVLESDLNDLEKSQIRTDVASDINRINNLICFSEYISLHEVARLAVQMWLFENVK
jgi:hypothetical protein